MARPASEYPTELELQILKVLWYHAPQPVSQVREALAGQDRKLAHTSVITTLNTMVRKDYLKRVKDGKTWLFSPRGRGGHLASHAGRRGGPRLRRFGQVGPAQPVRRPRSGRRRAQRAAPTDQSETQGPNAESELEPDLENRTAFEPLGGDQVDGTHDNGKLP